MKKQGWMQVRKKKLAKMRWPSTKASWLARWRKRIRALSGIAVDMWADRDVYIEYRAVVTSNPELNKGSGFLDLVDSMYISHVLLAVRRIADNDLRTISLYNLIEEIRDNPQHISRDWYINRFRRKSEGERQFKKLWGSKSHIDAARVNRDLQLLSNITNHIQISVNKNVAHNDRRKTTKPLTYHELNTAIDGIFDLVSRYHALILNTAVATPNVLSSHKIFTIPWAS